MAYESALQGMPLRDITSREAYMFRAKEAEFDALKRDPYKGPASKGFSNVQPSPLASSTIFGKLVPNNSPISQMFKQDTNMGGFGNGPVISPPQQIQPAAFSFPSPSPFPAQSVFPQNPQSPSPFTVQQPSPFNPVSSFGSNNAMQNAFSPLPTPAIVQSPFQQPSELQKRLRRGVWSSGSLASYHFESSRPIRGLREYRHRKAPETQPLILSSSWKALVDSALRDDHLISSTRDFQLPLLRDAPVVCLGNEYEVLEALISDRSRGSQVWRKLPPIENLPEGRAKIVAWSGMVLVWTLAPGKCWSPSRDLIFKLDVGGAKWTWDVIPAKNSSNWFDAIAFSGKIYSTWENRGSPYSLRAPVKLDVRVFDMKVDAYNTIGKWNFSNVAVALSPAGDENLYGLQWHKETVELMRYDAASSTWKPQEEIPRQTEHRNSTLTVVSGDCFDPPVKLGINAITYGYLDGNAIHWYNSAVQKTWMAIAENRPEEAASFKVFVIRGVLYAGSTSIDPKKIKRCKIFEGKIDVASRRMMQYSAQSIADRSDMSDTDLIPGLCDELALENILPRLPWYTRPVCRAVSNSWRALMDSALQYDAHLLNTTRNFQLPLLQDTPLVSLGNDSEVLQILILDRSQGSWRKLPPIEGLPVGRAQMVAWSGMVFVWTLAPGKSWSHSRDVIFKLDIGRAKWTWDRTPARRASNWFDAIAFGGKIYSSWEYRRSVYGIHPSVKLDVIVYDMETGTCDTIEKWFVSGAGVVLSPAGDEILYGFHDKTMELMRYEAASNAWKSQEQITGKPEFRTTKVVSGDCFEPAMEVGTNVISYGGEAMRWYNSAVQEAWVAIEKWPRTDRFKVLVIRGAIYAISRMVYSSGSLKHCEILRGKIDVANRRLVWDAVAEFPFPVTITCFVRMA
ncbi:hypothetical protein SELMODRAFT_407303 [Selaginella moellendorffii]|uniref:F-box domain-containing protein n=2 Tax=Selaginella moellendorffii TaxID=88036 RepID=D8R4K9_SELML|nr:hypothetical protein SELMODRAFT_407303 [Selaginella moellendorffii]